jgi:hypothetical protein
MGWRLRIFPLIVGLKRLRYDAFQPFVRMAQSTVGGTRSDLRQPFLPYKITGQLNLSPITGGMVPELGGEYFFPRLGTQFMQRHVVHALACSPHQA